MNINADFIHYEDTTFLIETCQKSFLAENVHLKVRTYNNAVIYQEQQIAGVYINNISPPPPIAFVMKKLCL